MNQIEIYHEAPLQIFDKVKELTEGDYALVHLLEQDEKYAAKFIEAAGTRNGRKVILDNSAYELGESFDESLFAMWVDTLRPDVYVVPDKPGDAEATIDLFFQWSAKWKHLPGKKMGVLQGGSVHEITDCFNKLQSAGADIIGIPFLIGRSMPWINKTFLALSLMCLRAQLTTILQQECKYHPIHLLGVSLPQEGVYHRGTNSWVHSVDTSNPVIHGMFGTRYSSGGGVDHKRTELLADFIHDYITVEAESNIWYNIGEFRRLWSR